MLENPEELIGGMKIILQLFDHAKGVLGIEDNKPDCIEKLTELVRMNRELRSVLYRPSTRRVGERQLIYAVTGRAINSKMLPADAGCIVDNVETIIAVYRAVKLGRPVTNRISTITGDTIANQATSYTASVPAMQNWWRLPADLRHSRRRLFPVVR